MGIKNYLIDGVSCAGKTTVCDELQRRGYHAIHGDRELAYWGDPKTASPFLVAPERSVPGCGTLRRSALWWPIKTMRQRSFAVVPGMPTVSSMCGMAFSF